MTRDQAVAWFESHLPGTDSGLASVREVYELAIEALREPEPAVRLLTPAPFVLKPGDVAVLEYAGRISVDAVARIREAWAERTGGSKPVILDGSLRLAGAVLAPAGPKAEPFTPSTEAEIAAFVETVKGGPDAKPQSDNPVERAFDALQAKADSLLDKRRECGCGGFHSASERCGP